jgi:hypothetical protein
MANPQILPYTTALAPSTGTNAGYYLIGNAGHEMLVFANNTT